jgi:hypothetical protein
MPPPQWRQLSPEQQNYLLEAFNLAPDMRGGFANTVPDDIKQNLLNSLWNVLTPEKRVQVALYAHIEKPFGQESDATAKVLAPQWAKLTSIQKVRVYEAAKWDGTQRAMWEAMPPELRQGAFDALWSYMDPKARQRVLAP